MHCQLSGGVSYFRVAACEGEQRQLRAFAGRGCEPQRLLMKSLFLRRESAAVSDAPAGASGGMLALAQASAAGWLRPDTVSDETVFSQTCIDSLPDFEEVVSPEPPGALLSFSVGAAPPTAESRPALDRRFLPKPHFLRHEGQVRSQRREERVRRSGHSSALRRGWLRADGFYRNRFSDTN